MGRKRIGLFFKLDDQWTGGLYYLYNIINSFTHLPSGEQPYLVIFYFNSKVIDDVKKMEYPFVAFLPVEKTPTLKNRILNKISNWLFRKPYPFLFSYSKNTVDYVFPFTNLANAQLAAFRYLKTVFWIPDFQHKYFPHYFSPAEVRSRDSNFDLISKSQASLVVSSENAKNDFQKYFPGHHVKLAVIPFATVLPKYDHLSIDDLKLKYGMTSSSYFISPNQFWAHKNHMVILKAVRVLQQEGLDFHVLFTGKENDYRNPTYTAELKEYVKQENLERSVKFLGFIERADQLKLMQEAVAVIQPSLFEGWSTVVEDTKAVNNCLILSDLEVHHEQCGALASYFNPQDEKSLANIMMDYLRSRKQRPFGNYEKAIADFAFGLLKL